MFTISTKSDYGLLLLALLAKKSRRDFVPLSSISNEADLPHAFVSRIAAKLSGAGILQSKEGSAGGYRLEKNPQQVSVARVIEILDGPWAPTKCAEEKKTCHFEKLCPMANHWQDHLKRKMWNLLESYTLKDLIS